MIRCGATLIFLRRSVASVRALSSSSQVFRLRELSAMPRFFSSGGHHTVATDDLKGLLGPDCDFAPNSECADKGKLQEVVPSLKDFAFLHEAVADQDKVLSRKIYFDAVKLSEEAVLISESIRSNGDDFGQSTEKFLRQFRGRLDETLVVEVLRLLKNPELGIRFFIWAGRQIGYCHTGPVFDTLLEVLGFDKKYKVPQQLLREIGEDDREVLRKLLNCLVRKCCRNGYFSMALEEMGRLKDFGYRPSRLTYNALVQALLMAEILDSAILVHREMSDSGHTMDNFTMACFVFSLCKVGKWEEALNIMEQEDFTPDTAIYNKMIGGLLEASLFEEAMSFMHRMRSNSCHPNVVTYKTLLSGFLKKQQLGWCKRIINMMVMEGCNPSLQLFNSLMHAYCFSGDYSYAYKLLKKMIDVRCNPDYVTYNILIGGICGNKDVLNSGTLQIAQKAYEEMLQSGFVLNKVNVGNFTRCLCSAGKFHKAFEVIKELMSNGFVPDACTYTNVIEFLCQANKVEKAFLLFEEMKGNRILPDVYTYTILIDSFCKAGLLQQACNWFDEMIVNGCAPNVVTYTALIHAHLKDRQISKANELFERMLSAGCQPNVVTYSALIDGLCKAGKVEKACQVYAKMRGSSENSDADMYFRDETTENTRPNVFTFGALVDGLCKTQKVVEARELLDVMLSNGCEPNHIVYDALIDGFCKVGRLDEAQELFLRMSEHGYTPNVYTYSSLIDRMFKDKKLDLALKILSRMLENSCAPNVVTYTEMIDGLCKVEKTDEALKLLLMMEEKGCIPNVVTYTAIIDGFGKAGNVEKCLNLLKQMTEKGCAPNFITYRVLINHCCAAGLLDEAHSLLEEMRQTYWPRNLANYQTVIEGYSREFLISNGLLDEMAKDGFEPVVPAYCILIDNLSKYGRLDAALDLHKDLISTASAFLSQNYNNTSSYLIESLCLASRMDDALNVYVEMTRRGAVPELITIFFIIKGLIKIGKWDAALQLSYSICHMTINWHLGDEKTSDEKQG